MCVCMWCVYGVCIVWCVYSVVCVCVWCVCIVGCVLVCVCVCVCVCMCIVWCVCVCVCSPVLFFSFFPFFTWLTMLQMNSTPDTAVWICLYTHSANKTSFTFCCALL